MPRTAAIIKSMPGVTVIEEEKVAETLDVQKTMKSMIELDGATLLFPTSFGYFDPHVLRVAEKYPKIQFRHCGGLWTKGQHPENAGSYFAGYIGMGQYLNGIVAGHTTKKSKKIGFVAAKPIPQVLNNINSFTLGARSVDPGITTQVIFTGEVVAPCQGSGSHQQSRRPGHRRYHMPRGRSEGFVIETAGRRGIFSCGYHVNQQKSVAPQSYLTGAEWNWASVYKSFVEKAQKGEPLANFVRGGLTEGFVKMSSYGVRRFRKPRASTRMQSKPTS